MPGSRRSLGEGNGNPLQYSCLENPVDREAWQAIVRRITKSWTQLSDTLSLSTSKNGHSLQGRNFNLYMYQHIILGLVCTK